MQEYLLVYLAGIFQVQISEGTTCVEDGQKLQSLVVTYTKKHALYGLLQVFAHSTACRDAGCVQLCRVLRRIRHHIATTHRCALTPLYAHLIRLHVDTCHLRRCDLHNCKEFRRRRQAANQKTLSSNFMQVENSIRGLLVEDEEIEDVEYIKVEPEDISECMEDEPSLVIDESPEQSTLQNCDDYQTEDHLKTSGQESEWLVSDQDPASDEGTAIDLSMRRYARARSGSLVSVSG